MAAMKAVNPGVSFAELQQWPDDGLRYELYDGEVVVVPAPINRHQRVVMHVAYLLLDYERATGGLAFSAPNDIVFSEYNVLQPDVLFFRHERRHLVDMMAHTRVPPDLAVEVLSPSTEARDRGRKMEIFSRFGVAEYWIIDPIANTLELYVHDGHALVLAAEYREGHEITSPTLPGLRFAAARVFEE